MVTFVPFAGFRPALSGGEPVADRVSPACESLNAEQLAGYRNGACNVVDIAATQDEDGHYAGAAARLGAMISEGKLRQDEPTFYYYEQTFTVDGTEYRRSAITGLLKIGDGKISTVSEPQSKVKADRLENIRAVGAQLESILAVSSTPSEDLGRRADNASRLLYRYVDADGTEHRFCRIADEATNAHISAVMEGADILVTAGTETYEAAVAYAAEDPADESRQYVLCTVAFIESPSVITVSPDKVIDAEDIGETSAIKKIGKRVALTEATEEDVVAGLGDHRIGLLFRSGRCFLADASKEYDDPAMAVDAVFARDEIVNGIYKSDEGKSKARNADLATARASIAAKEHDVAVIMKRPDVKTVWDTVMTKGRKLPRGTVELLPGILSGFVFNIMRKD